MTGLRELIELHVADQAERDAAARQAELRARMEELESAVTAARVEVEAAEADVKALQLERRAGEAEIQKLEDARTKYRGQLMSAKTNEIYKTLLSEIETAANAIGARETVVLEVMERIEAATAVADAAKKRVQAAQSAQSSEVSRLEADIAALEEERASARQRAAGLARHVPPALLSQYQRVREARDGRGMAEARNLECTACHVAIRPQAWVDLLAKQELLVCNGCRRFLYRQENLRGQGGAAEPAAS